MHLWVEQVNARGMQPYDPRLTPARPDLAAEEWRGRIEAPHYAIGHVMHVTTGMADVRRAPSHDAVLDTQALYGETLTLYEDHEGWGWVQLVKDQYVGYIAMAALSVGSLEATHRVKVNRTLVYSCPDLKMPARRFSPLGARVRVQGQKGAFAQIGETAFVFADHLAPVEAREADFVAVAERFLHTPYLWGGKTSLGIDCSGLVQVALDAAGIAAPRDTDLQEETLGQSLSAKTHGTLTLQRGDLIFWPGHVGIMQDATKLLHANAHRMLVTSEDFSTARERILAKTGEDIRTIKRLKLG